MFSTLRGGISATRVAQDLRKVLDEGDWHVELDGTFLSIDRDVPLEIVARSCHTYERDMSFGDHYRVLVAVGGVRGVKDGVPEPGLCFATIWYDPQLTLITVDFYRSLSTPSPA